jgi:hypothetical protein
MAIDFPVEIPADCEFAIVIEPDAFVTVIPVPAVNVVRVNPVPLPISNAPLAGVDVKPVPPEATAKVADRPAAVPVVFWLNVGQVKVPVLKLPDVGVPNIGVTNVGEVANTLAPVPVSSVRAAAKFAELGVARKVATPVPRPDTPVEIGRPVAFVKVALVGVPRIGVTRVGLVDNTLLPDPVEVVTPVPPFRTGSVPVTPVVKGKPVAFVSVTDVGVPNIGVTNVGEVANTLAPLPVSSVRAVAN